MKHPRELKTKSNSTIIKNIWKRIKNWKTVLKWQNYRFCSKKCGLDPIPVTQRPWAARHHWVSRCNSSEADAWHGIFGKSPQRLATVENPPAGHFEKEVWKEHRKQAVVFERMAELGTSMFEGFKPWMSRLQNLLLPGLCSRRSQRGFLLLSLVQSAVHTIIRAPFAWDGNSRPRRAQLQSGKKDSYQVQA